MLEFVTPGGNVFKIDVFVSLALVALLYILVTFIKRGRLNALKKRFSQGNIDGAFIDKCEKEIKIYRLRGNEYPYNLLCVMLGSAYLKDGNVDSFFEKLNSLRPVNKVLSRMVYILLIQFYTGINYGDISAQYPINAAEDDKSILSKVLANFTPCFVDEDIKTEKIENLVHNEFVKKCFTSFQETYKQQQKQGKDFA